MARDRFDIFMETMSDWADTHRQALTKIDSTLATLVESQNNLTVKIDKLTERIDNLAMVTDSNRIIVNNLIALATSQQETVNRLLTAKVS